MNILKSFIMVFFGICLVGAKPQNPNSLNFENLKGSWSGFTKTMVTCSDPSIQFEMRDATKHQGMQVNVESPSQMSLNLLYSAAYLLERMEVHGKDPKKAKDVEKVVRVLKRLPDPVSSHCVSKRSGTYRIKDGQIFSKYGQEEWIFCHGIEKPLARIFGPEFPGQGKERGTKAEIRANLKGEMALVYDSTDHYKEDIAAGKMGKSKKFWPQLKKCIAGNHRVFVSYLKIID